MRVTPTMAGAAAITLVLAGFAVEAAWRTNPVTNAPTTSLSPSLDGTASASAARPAAIEFTPLIPDDGDVRAVASYGDAVIAGDKSRGVFVIGAQGAHPPLDISGEPVAIDVSGTRAAVSAAWGGLVLLDISDPEKLRVLDTWPTTALTKDAAFFGDHLLVADWNDGVHVLRVSEAGELEQVGSLLTKGHAVGVSVAGDLGFVADFEGGLVVISLVDPSRPTLVSTFKTPAAASVVASGTSVFVCDEQRGLLLLDADDPKALVQRGQYPVAGQAHALALHEQLVALGDLNGGTWTLDVSDPASPTLTGTATREAVHALALDDRRVYRADGALMSAPRPTGDSE